ncbi:hypothetical protein ACFXTH_026850 [Malus domestica]
MPNPWKLGFEVCIEWGNSNVTRTNLLETKSSFNLNGDRSPGPEASQILFLPPFSASPNCKIVEDHYDCDTQVRSEE